MPGDPRHCRQQAVECLRLAQTLASPEGIDTFSDLARSWLKLAVDLERSQIFLKSYIGGVTGVVLAKNSRQANWPIRIYYFQRSTCSQSRHPFRRLLLSSCTEHGFYRATGGG